MSTTIATGSLGQRRRGILPRVVKPGPPSEEYLLRKLLYCDRCGERMHGTRGSRPPIRRYLCSTRRYGHGCDQPITKAEPLKAQLVQWLSDFQPDEELRTRVLAHVQQAARRQGGGELRRANSPANSNACVTSTS